MSSQARSSVFQQALHVADLAVQPLAQLVRRQVAVMGDAQARQRRAQFVGQGAQQQTLLGEALAQACGHVLQGLGQLAEFVAARRQRRGERRRLQFVGAQGVGAVAQAVQRRHQVAVEQQAEQGGQQGRDYAVGDQASTRGQPAGQQAFRQLDHQPALFGMIGKLDADVRQFVLQAPAHWPVELAHEGQVARFRGAQRRAAEAFQVRADQRHPGVFLRRQFLAEAFGARGALAAPGILRLPRVVRQVAAVGGGEEVGAALHRQAPGVYQPGQQQAETDLQQRQFPQQRMPAHQGRSVSTSR